MAHRTTVYINQIGSSYLLTGRKKAGDPRDLVEADILSENYSTIVVRLAHDGRIISRKLSRDFPTSDKAATVLK